MIYTEPVTPVLTFNQERAQDCFTEAKPLLEVHWAEIAHYKDIPLDPDWDAYRTMEDSGHVRTYTLRERGELKGYAVFFVRANVHYRGSLQAVQDILYLAPELRKQLLGFRFIQWCDERLAKEGIQVVYQHVKLAYNFGPVLHRMGYEAVETIWSRRLDKE